jgi:glycosyltransferase involved in cell wall biosynthesis
MLEGRAHALEHGALNGPSIAPRLSDDAAHRALGAAVYVKRCGILRAVRRRVAFIDYFATHYRRRLYEELADRMEVDFYFFADERERYWNRRIPLVAAGDFRRIELRRYRVAGEPVMPGLARELSGRRYDAVVKSLNGRLMLPLVYFTSKTRAVPFVLWTGMWYHPQTAFHRASRPLTERLYRTADAIVAYGDHVKRFVVDSGGIDPRKVYVAGQAVEPERFRSIRSSPEGSTDVLFVGQFEDRKGVLPLLDAFAAVSDVSAKLRLVGNGSLEAEVSRRAARDRRVELVGYVPQSALPAELARARCLVLPSVTTKLDREPWGLVVNEAMHAGVPVVATDAVGAAAGGLVRDGRNGFVVPERDVSALTSAMRRLIEDPALARRMGDRGRVDVERFSHRAMADAFEAAVEHAVTAPARRVRRGPGARPG